MPLNLDSMFSVHERALSLANQRLELLANNVANADTPGFKARDIDFRAAMQEAGDGNLTLAATRPGHIGGNDGRGPRAAALYRNPDQPSLDGNTVDPQKENAAIAETAVRYQATLTFLNARIRGLRDALTGGR